MPILARCPVLHKQRRVARGLEHGHLNLVPFFRLQIDRAEFLHRAVCSIIVNNQRFIHVQHRPVIRPGLELVRAGNIHFDIRREIHRKVVTLEPIVLAVGAEPKLRLRGVGRWRLVLQQIHPDLRAARRDRVPCTGPANIARCIHLLLRALMHVRIATAPHGIRHITVHGCRGCGGRAGRRGCA